MLKQLAWWCLAVAILVNLAACETVKGVGRDISKAGDAIEDAAK